MTRTSPVGDRPLRGLGEQVVPDEIGQRIADPSEQCLRTAPRVRLVHDVVVHKAGPVQQFDAGCHLQQAVGVVGAEMPRQQRESGPQALAAAREDHRQHRTKQRVVRLSRFGQRTLDRRQTILHQGERRDSADHSDPLSRRTAARAGNTRWALSVVARSMRSMGRP